MENPFYHRRVAISGKLGSMTLQEASALIRKLGGKLVSPPEPPVDVLLLGADEPSPNLSPFAATEVLTELELWQRLGVQDPWYEDDATRQLYTPAMLAQLIHAPVHAIRRWHRAGLLLAERTIHRLPYFPFEEINVARRLAELLAHGVSLPLLQRQLESFTQRYPHLNRPLAEPSCEVNGNHWSVRVGEQRVSWGGQQHFDFNGSDVESDDSVPISFPLQSEAVGEMPPTLEQLMAAAEECDSSGDTSTAARLYQTAIDCVGPRADLFISLGDCLYRLGDLPAACEQYRRVVERDPEHVEGWSNLGCVLAELGDKTSAITAFCEALRIYPDYADAHWHLARLYDQLGQPLAAAKHGRRFAELSRGTAWASLADAWGFETV